MSRTAGSSQSLQALVDALSAALQRPVLLDDAALRPLAASSQAPDARGARRRGATAALRRALREQGIAEASGALRIERLPEFGIEERVCASVRVDGDVLGYLWVLDPDRELGGEALGRVASAARRAAHVIAAAGHPPLADERALIAGLRSAGAAERQRAANEVRERGLLPDRPLVVCAIAASEPGVDAWASAQRMVRRLAAGNVLAGSDPIGATLLVSLNDPVLGVLDVEGLAGWLRGTSEHDVAVGQSDVVDGLDDVAEGYRHAALALRAALARAPEEREAAWAELGPERLLAQLPSDLLRDLPPRLAQLLRDEPTLAETLATYLDAACDAKATARALKLHRNGLYYRLGRIEELTGLRLDRGNDRLLAHLAVRLAELA